MAFSWGNYGALTEGATTVTTAPKAPSVSALTEGQLHPDAVRGANTAHDGAALYLACPSVSALTEGRVVDRRAGMDEASASEVFSPVRSDALPSVSASDRAPIPQEPHGVTGALNLLAPFHAVKGKP